uniref:Uncharacterized protein n=1 Tax=Roseihalotalea indica TaxID=2867963 RepID=A0AA49GJ47_9BACT|nr:hypothetical protein K4G66_19745 [Tunicatimonas sp. TK19036]
MQLPFLNFSTLALRHNYCQQELHLRRRLAPNMHLAVLPVQYYKGHFYIGKE